ncbi:MAG: putative phosphotransferase related to Ser/Thr protein kinase [Deltaproteobacteria bacterium]|nr:putative phosphotransferase related to Ser/Thr protein kinase [Deltaproteobacteria bacterium]
MNHENEIAVFARTMINIDSSYDIAVKPLSARGSDRVFYRVLWNDRTAVAIHYDTDRIENAYYADIAVFLKKMRIPVPELLAHDPAKHIMILDDLGDTDLFSLGTHEWPERRVLYQKTLGAVQRLHKITEKKFSSEGVRLMDAFTPDLYLWEQNYFLDNFVKRCCDLALDPGFEAKLRAELTALSERLCTIRRSLIHRDFQSRNIMVRNGEPYFIDFQGMRFGNPFYDLASLLIDPYVSIPDEGREELLSFYYVLSSQELDWDTYQRSFWDAGVERLMQALGAYGFLGKVKGLEDFLRFIPAGLSNINLALSHVPSLASLRDVILLCQVAIG